MIEIVEADRNRFPEVAALWNEVWPEIPIEEEELAHDEAVLKPHQRSRYWIGWREGGPIGLAELGPVPGSYHPRHWSLHVAVPAGLRGQGIGSGLYDVARAHVGPEPPLTLSSQCKENDDPSYAFLAKRGYRETKRDFQSALELDRINMEALEEFEQRPLPPELQIRTLAEVDSPSFRAAFHHLFEDVRKDIPRLFPPTPMEPEEFEAQMVDLPFLIREGCLIAFQGDAPIGFTTEFRGVQEGRLDQGLTAVRKDFRGKGVASALKARAMRWAMSQGFKFVRTDNDSRNAPMIAINDRLGFTRLPATISMQWSAQ